MASVKAFDELMTQFLEELKQTFPEESKIINTDTITLQSYMSSISTHSQKIMNKDETFFTGSETNRFLDDLNLKHWWTSELSQNTKNAIWQYLQTLFMMGTTIQAVPPEMMGAIEKIAENCVSQLGDNPDPTKILGSLLGGGGGSGGGGGPDLSGIMGMMGQMFGGGGEGESGGLDLMELLGDGKNISNK